MNVEQLSMNFTSVVILIVTILGWVGTVITFLIKTTNRFTSIEEKVQKLIKDVEEVKEIETCSPKEFNSMQERILIVENRQHEMDINYAQMATSFDYTSKMIENLKRTVTVEIGVLKEEQNKMFSKLNEWLLTQKIKGD